MQRDQGPALGQVFANIRGTVASLMSSKGTPEGLQRIILSWDFWEIDRSVTQGGGVIPELEALPQSFDSAEVCGRASTPFHLMYLPVCNV